VAGTEATKLAGHSVAVLRDGLLDEAAADYGFDASAELEKLRDDER